MSEPDACLPATHTLPPGASPQEHAEFQRGLKLIAALLAAQVHAVHGPMQYGPSREVR